MAVTVTAGGWRGAMFADIASGTGVTDQFADRLSTGLLSSVDGSFVFDRVWHLDDYDLLTSAGNFDVDLYDLGSIDLGAGAGQDNLGLSHANARIIAIAISNNIKSGGGQLRIDSSGLGGTAWEGLFHGSTQLDLAQGAFINAYLGEDGATVTDSTDHVLRFSAQTANCNISISFLSRQT